MLEEIEVVVPANSKGAPTANGFPVQYAGCYTLHLYCDNFGGCYGVPDNNRHSWAEFPHEFSGESFQDCAKQAQNLGWAIHKKTHTATCPKCNPKRRRSPDAPV